jgi:hypothetical protein
MYGECQTSLGNSDANIGPVQGSAGRCINSWLFSVQPIRRYDVE